MTATAQGTPSRRHRALGDLGASPVVPAVPGIGPVPPRLACCGRRWAHADTCPNLTPVDPTAGWSEAEMRFAWGDR